MIRKLYYIKKLLILGCLLFFQMPVLAMDNFVVHLAYVRCDGNSAFLVDTADGVCIFTKKYKENHNAVDPNDINKAFLMDMSGVCCKEIWHDNAAYPKIAAAYDQNQAYLLVIGKNENATVVTVFNNNGEVVKELKTRHKIWSAIPIKVVNDIGFILLTHSNSEKAFLWFLNDKPCRTLQQNNYILSCAGVNTPWGYQIVTGSRNTTYDGFMKVWDYEELSSEQVGQSQPCLQINSMTWWDTACFNVCKILPRSIHDLLPYSIITPHDCKDKFVDIAAIQSHDGDVFFIAASENGAKIGKINKHSIVLQPDINILRKGLVSCVAAVSTPQHDLFLAVLGDKIYIYTVHGIYVKELDFIIEKDNRTDGFSALCKDDQIYIVAKNGKNFCTWILDAQNYNIIERHDFLIDDIMWS